MSETHVVMFSGGLGSWMTAKRVAAKYGTDNLVMLFADVGNDRSPHVGEDEDTYRFIEEAAANVGGQLVRVTDGRDIWQVFTDDRFLGNSRLANCSKFLKQKPCRDWLEANHHPNVTTVYVGIDWSESHRIPAIEAGWAPYRVEAPLTEPPYLDRDDMLVELTKTGIEIPRLYRAGFAHNNCFAPETRFITSEGIRSLSETVGKNVRVLGTGGGWKDAAIKSFGEQETLRLTVSRYGDSKTITVTGGHRWPIRLQPGRTSWSLKTTDEISPGDRIAGMYGQVRHNVTPSSVGIMAGFTFGDGTVPNYFTGQIGSAKAFIVGDKDQAVLPFFAGCRRTTRPDGSIEILDLPRSWKMPPDLSESQSYLYGWLVGYFAADGTFSGQQARLASSRADHIAIVRDVCARIGIGTMPMRTEMRLGYGSEKSALYTVALILGTLRSDFFLIDEHRRRFEGSKRSRPADWQVVDIAPGQRMEVMCAVVGDGHMFTLEDNLFTSNCGGFCVRAGQAQMELLLREHPERYLFHESEEQKLRAYLDKDVSVLRDRSGGTSVPLTLTAFRERIEDQPSMFDPFDVGGCGCFTEGDTA